MKKDHEYVDIHISTRFRTLTFEVISNFYFTTLQKLQQFLNINYKIYFHQKNIQPQKHHYHNHHNPLACTNTISSSSNNNNEKMFLISNLIIFHEILLFTSCCISMNVQTTHQHNERVK